MQDLPLDEKIQISKTRIIEFYNHYDGLVYFGFSGGKDSKVLEFILRSVYPDVPGVFCDTGLEYPELRQFVKYHRNIDWIYPSLWNKHTRQYERCTFKNVIEKCGYPIVSKQVSNVVNGARSNLNSVRGRRIRGELPDAKGNPGASQFNCQKWEFLLDAPFKISDQCCAVMKKNPNKVYQKETGRKPVLGLLAEESQKRRMDYMKTGCNAFDKERPQSQPLGFWREQDILHFLDQYHDDMLDAIHTDMRILGFAQDEIDKVVHPWAPVYGELVKDTDGKYHFTKADRTGCMFCGYGAHLEKSPNRFQRMKDEHPKQYDFCMRECNKGGLGLAEVLDYIGVEYK